MQWIFQNSTYLDLNTGNRIPVSQIGSFPNKVQLVHGTNAVWVSKLGSNTVGNGSPDKPYKTILNAINNCPANGYIVVDGHGGEWTETMATVNLASKKIVGDGNCSINGTGVGSLIIVSSLSLYNLKIKNATIFSASGYGNNTIINCTFISSNIGYIAGWETNFKFCKFIKCSNIVLSYANPVSINVKSCSFIECTSITIGGYSSIGSIHNTFNEQIYYKSTITVSALLDLRYSSLIDCLISLPAVTVSGYTWLDSGLLRYDGVSGRDIKLQGSIGALHGVGQATTTNEPYRMYRVHAINGASVNLTSIGGATGAVVGTLFTSNATSVTLSTLDSGLVLERLAHNLETLRQRHYLYNTLANNSTIHNLEGVKVHANNPFTDYDSTNNVYNTTLVPSAVENTASQTSKPIGASGEGMQIAIGTDVWTAEPPTNITILTSPIDYADATGFPASFKTNVLNRPNTVIDYVDFNGLQAEAAKEFWTVLSNIGTTTVTTLVVGNFYWNDSAGATITLAGTGRQITANGVFFAQTGETSFTGTSTVYALPLTRQTYELRWSNVAFANNDASPNWFTFMWGQKPYINTNDNTPSGTVTKGNGDSTFDHNNQIELPTANFFQFRLMARNDNLTF